MIKLSRLMIFALILPAAAVGLATHPASADEEPTPTYYESFDDGNVDGVVGKAGKGSKIDPRRTLNLDRGTMACFVQVAQEPVVREWSRLFGLNGMRGGAYWSMLAGFDTRLEDFNFNLYDVGRYSPPLKLESPFGRWKEGQWVHLAAVWDRFEGIKVYEDGKLVNSNWGKHQWRWNLIPDSAFFNGTIDEAYFYDVPLTDAQVAQLAKGETPTGSALPIKTGDARDKFEREAMGWQKGSVEKLPVVKSGEGVQLTFAEFEKMIDAKRPHVQLFEGLSRSTWPNEMYGASIRGRSIDMYLRGEPSYDRVRVFVHRPFEGEFRSIDKFGREHSLAPFTNEFATIWHEKLDEAQSANHVKLERKYGAIGQVDFYRVDPLKAALKDVMPFTLAKVDDLPASEAAESLIGETPSRFRSYVEGRTEAADPWTLSTEAFGGFQGVTTPIEKAHAFDGVHIKLVAEGVTKRTPVRITIKEPVHGMRDWLVADAVLEPKGSGKQTWELLVKARPVINMPQYEKQRYWKDGKYHDETDTIPGEPFGIAVVAGEAVTWHMGKGGTTFSFAKTDMKKALPAAIDDQVAFMREGYSDNMEGHGYDARRFRIPLTWLCMFAPDRMETQQAYHRIGAPRYFQGIDVNDIELDTSTNPTDAPEWAYWQKRLLDEHVRLIHWRIDNWQLENGEYGGVWNDDTTHIDNWLGFAMSMDDSDKIKDSLRKFYDGVWDHNEEGVCKYTMDLLHMTEDGQGALALAPVLFYGEPTAMSRLMHAASHYDKWLYKDDEGKWVVKSGWVSAHGAWDRFNMTIMQGRYGGTVMVSAAYMIWYNRHPMAMMYMKGHPGGSKDLHSAAQDIANEVPQDELFKQLEDEVAKPLVRGRGAQYHNYRIDAMGGVTDRIREFHKQEFQQPGEIMDYWGAKQTGDHYFYWRVSGDIRYLTESYKRALEWFPSHDWLNTAAEPSRDRSPLPRWGLIRSRMGGLPGQRTTSMVGWPYHAISWTKGANDVAALVTDNTTTSFAVRLYPFTDGDHDMTLRSWRLNPGRYKVSVMTDKNDDGVGEDVIKAWEQNLDRGAYIDVTIPAKATSVLKVEAIESSEPNYDLPDPAVGPGTVEAVYDEHLVVHVYNLGTKPVKNLLVRVTDGRSGAVLMNGEQRVDIEVPLDMQPQKVGIEVKNFNANAYGSVVVEVDPEGEIEDLNRHNNRYELRF